jgi:hypothetical protein
MANIVKKVLDTRTFPEICKSLSQNEWLEIRNRMWLKLGKTEQTLLNWRWGKTYPLSLVERKTIADIVNQVLKIRTQHNTLFRV